MSHVINKTRFVSEEISNESNAAKELNYYAQLWRVAPYEPYQNYWYAGDHLNQSIFGEVVKGVERSCYHKGYSLTPCTEGDNERMRIYQYVVAKSALMV